MKNRAYINGEKACRKALKDMVGELYQSKECHITSGMTDGGILIQMTMDISKAEKDGVVTVMSVKSSCVVNANTGKVVKFPENSAF